jgi:hypothetical protein
MEEAFVAGCDVSAFRRLHINQQLEQMPGLVKNPVGMINPLHRSVQIKGFPQKQSRKR